MSIIVGSGSSPDRHDGNRGGLIVFASSPERPRLKWRLLIVALATVVLLAACRPPFPGQDPFYNPPGPPPVAAPGTVLDSRPSVFTLDPVNLTPHPGVTARQVMYSSRDALGAPMTVSGTVLVPDAPWFGVGQRPLVSWAVGTRGVGDNCAPSYTMSQGADYEAPFIAAALARGWAVAVSDYQGLGTAGVHTYMVGPAQGHAVLDMARAAQQLGGTGLSPTSPVGVMGYSQGGGAAGWAAELAGSYAPELEVKGVVAGGVPGDLTATAEFLDGSIFVGLALLAAIGLDEAYPELGLDGYLNARGDALVETAREFCLVSVDGIDTLINTAFTHIDDYVTTNPLATAPWQARLAEQKLGSRAPSAPVFQYHGVVDEIVPYGQAAKLRRDWCNRGAKVTWTNLPGEHVLGMVEGAPLAMTWLDARFAGLPTFGNCWVPF
jgi:hypothetical protein